MFRVENLNGHVRRAAEHVLAAADAALAFEVEPGPAVPRHPHRRAAAPALPSRRPGTVSAAAECCLAPQTRRAAPAAARVLR